MTRFFCFCRCCGRGIISSFHVSRLDGVSQGARLVGQAQPGHHQRPPRYLERRPGVRIRYVRRETGHTHKHTKRTPPHTIRHDEAHTHTHTHIRVKPSTTLSLPGTAGRGTDQVRELDFVSLEHRTSVLHRPDRDCAKLGVVGCKIYLEKKTR